MGKGSQHVTQETSYKPSPAEQEMINLALPYLKDFANNPPPFPGTSNILPFNSTQLGAQQGILNQVPGMQDFTGAAGKGAQFLFSGDVLDPKSNPGLQGAIDAATRPIIQSATQELLPNVRGNYATLGQYGSTRQGLAEGQIADATMRNVGDTAANVVNENYKSGLEAMTKGLALSPMIAQESLLPWTTMGSVGDMQHALGQAQLTEQNQNAILSQAWPLILGQEILGAGGMIPGGKNVTSGEVPGPDPFSSILGAMTSIIPLFGFL